MRVLRDFKCESGHVTERYIDSETEMIPCNSCEKIARRIVSFGTIILDGTDPSLPGAWNKWATIREKRHQQNAKKKNS
jgi:hypothetical protein